MPRGLGVNSYIDIEKQRFQTLDDAVKLVKPGYYLAKVDLRHAYRSIPVHPTNYTALGFKWKFTGDNHFSYLVDTRLPFGGRSAPGIFHRITQAVKRMMARRGFHLLVVYLDDFLVIGESQAAYQEAYDVLCSLLLDLGFELSSSKLVPPTPCIVFLGVEIDSVYQSLLLPATKLQDLRLVIQQFLTTKRVTKGQLQRLAGKLNWACKVVYGGRTFLRRILNVMNSLKFPSSRCRLTAEFYGDLQWWNDFLETFNGKCDFLDDRPVTTLYTDASTNGVDASFEGNWFYSYFPVDFPWSTHLHMNYKEVICVVFAALYWAPYWQNKSVVVRCDNTAAVAMLNKGSTKHPVMMVFLRMLFWLSATYNFHLKAYHIPGVANVEADHVSRFRER